MVTGVRLAAMRAAAIGSNDTLPFLAPIHARVAGAEVIEREIRAVPDRAFAAAAV